VLWGDYKHVASQKVNIHERTSLSGNGQPAYTFDLSATDSPQYQRLVEAAGTMVFSKPAASYRFSQPVTIGGKKVHSALFYPPPISHTSGDAESHSARTDGKITTAATLLSEQEVAGSNRMSTAEVVVGLEPDFLDSATQGRSNLDFTVIPDLGAGAPLHFTEIEATLDPKPSRYHTRFPLQDSYSVRMCNLSSNAPDLGSTDHASVASEFEPEGELDIWVRV